MQDEDGLIWITYDRDRGGAGEILVAKFREEDVAAGKDVSGAVSLKYVINKLDKLDAKTKSATVQTGASFRTTHADLQRLHDDAESKASSGPSENR